MSANTDRSVGLASDSGEDQLAILLDDLSVGDLSNLNLDTPVPTLDLSLQNY